MLCPPLTFARINRAKYLCRETSAVCNLTWNTTSTVCNGWKHAEWYSADQSEHTIHFKICIIALQRGNISVWMRYVAWFQLDWPSLLCSDIWSNFCLHFCCNEMCCCTWPISWVPQFPLIRALVHWFCFPVLSEWTYWFPDFQNYPSGARGPVGLQGHRMHRQPQPPCDLPGACGCTYYNHTPSSWGPVNQPDLTLRDQVSAAC